MPSSGPLILLLIGLMGPGFALAAEGPMMLLFSGAQGPQGAERAYTAARPFLGDQAPSSVQSLASVTRVDDAALLVTGDLALTCGEVSPVGTLTAKLTEAAEAAYGLEPDVAAAAIAVAQRHLACGVEPVRPEDARALLRARGAAAWFSGEAEVAAGLWHELFILAPGAQTDADLPPDALAAQLDAKARAARSPVTGDLTLAVPTGWVAHVDGVAVEGRTVALAAGERVVRLRGPTSRSHGMVLELMPGADLAVGTGAGLAQELSRPEPSRVVLSWLGAQLAAAAAATGAAGVLLVDLSPSVPTVRRFEDGDSLILTAPNSRATASSAAGSPRGGTKVGSAVLLGAGALAAGLGIALAAVAHAQGRGLADSMQTVSGFNSAHAAYQQAQVRERVGVGVAIGGGVVAAVGGITLPIPSSRRKP